MTVGEVMAILKDCDQDRNVYIMDLDHTAQLVTAIGDLKHVNIGIVGISIPDDVYLMTSAQFAEFGGDDHGDEQPAENPV